MSALQSVFATVALVIGVAGASLLWPKFTNKPIPAPLAQVRSVVQQTPLGQQASQVLGESTDGHPGPVNLSEWAATQGNAIVTNIEQSASHAVVSGVVRQLIGQIDTLPQDQKAQLQQILCATQSAAKQ